MAYYDRDYYRDPGGGRGAAFLYYVRRALTATIPLGSLFDIRIRLHVLFFVMPLWFWSRSGLAFAVPYTIVLFGSVLLHEFGHALSCRRVGGTADDILMWPLGGLASVAPPHSPWAHFWTTAWGPLVNVIICALVYVPLAVLEQTAVPVSFNPLAAPMLDSSNLVLAGLHMIFWCNYFLLCFNLALLFYPFDGGRLVQTALWFRLGYGRSMYLAATVGLGGAVVIGVIGLLLRDQVMLVFIALFGGWACWQQRQQLRHGGPVGAGFGESYGGGGGFDAAPEPRESRRAAKQREKAARAAQKRDDAMRAAEAEVDTILDKVQASGMHSLTEREKKVLRDATNRKRTG